MSKVSHQYAAGLLDGEGTITLTRHKAGAWRAPTVSITSTTPEFLVAMQETYGGYISKHTRKSDVWAEAWSWKITNDPALELLHAVHTFLLEPKKKRRALHLMAHYKMVTPRNGKYTEEMVTRKQRFEDKFFDL